MRRPLNTGGEEFQKWSDRYPEKSLPILKFDRHSTANSSTTFTFYITLYLLCSCNLNIWFPYQWMKHKKQLTMGSARTGEFRSPQGMTAN